MESNGTLVPNWERKKSRPIEGIQAFALLPP